MPDLKTEVSKARTWATSHLVAAGAICLAVGLVVGALLF